VGPEAATAVAELPRNSGTQFDAEVIAAFQAELAAPSHDRSEISAPTTGH
jgi:hypothetical protein